ncbi:MULTISPECIES: DUF1223 domain-containing protein [Brevundimonas]|uniref:DUF1223 domain-containing protein n=1 Tax=Brevundimonas TaxID=41275 RepID=UPI000F02B3BE|nr:DUF1223 domain-containing protein [Brevundimonas lutea]
MIAASVALMGAARIDDAQSATAVVVAPVVVELFTAQGCAGCPEANRLIEDMADRPGVLALTYAVDYWDYLGWPDTFARPEFAERQRAYRRGLRQRSVYTPQVVIDGRRQAPGGQASAVEAAVRELADTKTPPPEIEFRATGDGVGVGSGRAPAGGAEVWMVRYRPGEQVVEVAGGENRGRSISHVNVVRDVRRLGEWRGEPILLALPDAGEEGLKTAVIVQARPTGAILAAATR